MAIGKRLIPNKINLDKASELMEPNEARFIKNLTAYLGANGQYQGVKEGHNQGKLKSVQANEIYVFIQELASTTESYIIGSFPSKETNSVFAFLWTDNGNNIIYRINGKNRSYDIVWRGQLNWQRKPEHFISEVNVWLEVAVISDPSTGQRKDRSFLMFTDGINQPRQICVEDSIATDSFNASLYPYFAGIYDRTYAYNMGIPTPLDCVELTEKMPTEEDLTKNNGFKYNTWQLRITDVDVWGRPSEHGIISDLYIPGINDCIANSNSLPRCLEARFPSGSPFVDKKIVEYRNCNSQQWYRSDVIEKYVGSSLGEWWLRERNPDVVYDDATGEIIYTFCADKECIPLPVEETNRTQNPIPRVTQAISKIGDVVALSNNKTGYTPFSKDLLDKINFIVDKPEPSANNNATRKIEVYFKIYNPFGFSFDAGGGVFTADNQTWFGRTRVNQLFPFYLQFRNYGQTLTPKGFVGYLSNGDYAISKQYVKSASGELEEFQPVDWQDFDNSKEYYQKLEFNSVPKGMYTLRLASHYADPINDSQFRDTSTYLAGVVPFDFLNTQSPIGYSDLQNNALKELEINVCDGDYNTLSDNRIMVVYDMVGDSVIVVNGYVYEKDNAATGGTNIPVEGLYFNANETVGGQNIRTNSRSTDHNGYFFVAGTQDRYQFNFKGACNCQPIEIIRDRSASGNQLYPLVTYYIENRTGGGDNAFISDCPSYSSSSCNRILLKGKVTLCNSNIGVPNVSVTLSGSKSVVTDSNGEYTIIAHDLMSNNAILNRPYKIYYNGGSCGSLDCNGGCLAPVEGIISPCVSCSERIIEISTVELSYEVKRGLLSGGRYGAGTTGHDLLGGHNFVQNKDADYFNIPSMAETQTFDFSSLRVVISPDAIFPDWVRKLTFYITAELSMQDYISWIVDDIELIDNTGNENTIAPSQIKIYYRSLNEYNKQNNFNTTTGWGIIADSTTIPRVSDYVEFIYNDGKFYNKQLKSQIKYDSNGQYFLIDFENDLRDLKSGALIRLVRPSECEGQDIFFELCGSINVINGVPQRLELPLNAFDTYFKYRSIPVPVETGTDNETVNELRTFGFPFEHHSPSDFWGYKCKNVGRVNTKNPYEAEIYDLNQVALSGAISINGQLNYLNYFSESKMTRFEVPNATGGIVALLFEMGIALVLCQYDQFTVGYNDNLARVNADGSVQVPSAASQFGKPQRKIGSNFGCLLKDKSTIRKRDGIVVFLDRVKSDLLQHNFSDVRSLIEGQCEAWFKAKISSAQSDSNKYFVGCINPATGVYLLTDYSISDSSYINNERSELPGINETVSWDMVTRELREWHSFTPEYYAYLDGDVLNKQLFSFKNGQPYSHYNLNQNAVYNTFYGEVVDRVLRVVYVLDPMKSMRPLSLANYGNLFFVDKVLTDTNQETRMLLSAWKRENNFYKAPFLCDLNTTVDINLRLETGDNKLMDGTPIHVKWADIRMIGDPSENSLYTQTTGIIVNSYAQNPTGESNG
jgi:hypothetical protein